MKNFEVNLKQILKIVMMLLLPSSILEWRREHLSRKKLRQHDKEFGFTAGMLKGSLAEGRKKS